VGCGEESLQPAQAWRELRGSCSGLQNPLYLAWKERVQDGEERWQACGEVEGLSLLIVAHTIREELEDGNEIEVVRIISARRAEPKERRRYEKENG
jgi:uncharacterized DUF497 family protein